MWPSYDSAIPSVVKALRKGGPMSGYRSSKAWGVGPQKWSWAHKFERELEKRFKVRHAIALNSGTMALKAALFALNLPPGSEVITTPFSFSATPASIVMLGHKPVFVDVNPYDFTIDPEKVKRAITKKTAAIMPVDLFGGLANYAELEKHGLPIISDHCQAVGAERDGKRFFGTIGANSGNGAKNLPLGEGGWAMTDDKKLADRMRLYISHAENFDTDWVGDNGRMPEMTAILGYHGLLELEGRNRRRRDLAARFNAVRHVELVKHGVTRTFDDPEGSHVFYVYPFTFKSKVKGQNREWLINHLEHEGVKISGGYVTPPLHHYEAFRKYARGPLPVVDELSFRTLCLISSFTPDQPLSHADEVAEAFKEVLCD